MYLSRGEARSYLVCVVRDVLSERYLSLLQYYRVERACNSIAIPEHTIDLTLVNSVRHSYSTRHWIMIS